MTTAPFPDIVRTGTVVIGTRYVGDPDQQQLVTDSETHTLDRTPPPRGLTAVSWFASTDGETVLTLAQWEGADLGPLPAQRRRQPRPAVHRVDQRRGAPGGRRGR
jgi:hypothetical protein